MPAKKPRKRTPRAKATAISAAAAKRAAFVEAYIANGRDGAKAMITAGYSKKAAAQAASRMLKNVEVKAALEKRFAELQREAEEKTGVTVTGVLTELRALVHSDLRRAFHPKSGELLPPHLWPDELARAMCSIKVVEMDDGTKKHVPMYVKEVKLWDKGSSLERAMKHLGMFKVDNAQRGDAAIRALMEAVSERSAGFEVKP